MKKHCIRLVLAFCIMVGATPVMAGNVVSVDINISGLERLDLGAFDLDVSFDENAYEFIDYFPTDALGSISLGDAEDWSYGFDSGSGSVNIALISYLTDLARQPSEFTLATIVFEGDDAVNTLNAGPSGFSIAVNDLSDTFGASIPFSVSGTEINAIPVPAAAWLLGSGLLGLAALRRR